MSAPPSPTRPPTSKPRGICRYYTHPRGCFAGDACKFLHGEPSEATPDQPLLTPYDKSKRCRYYKNGFCKRGDKCWFLHVSDATTHGEASNLDELSNDESCSVCFEKPVTFGLLSGCSHVFCITCIRQWRDPNGKAGDMVCSGNTKKCPMCRTPSKFITPSSRFFRQEDPEKEKIVQAYKESMAKVPCRYFRQSKQKDKNNPQCPFGKDCFYQHLNDDGTPYIFKDGVDVRMTQHRMRNNRRSDAGVFFPFQLSIDEGFNFFFNPGEMDIPVPWRRNEGSNLSGTSAERSASAVRRLRDLSRSLEAINNVISDNVDADALSAAVEAMRRGLSSLDQSNRSHRRRRITTPIEGGWDAGNDWDSYDDQDEGDEEENEVMERLELLADEMLVSLNNFRVSTDPDSDESESLPPLEPFGAQSTETNSNDTITPARQFRWASIDDHQEGNDDLPSLRSVSNSSGDEYDSERDDDNLGGDASDSEESVGHPRAVDAADHAVDAVREGRARERLERLGRTWPLFQFLSAAGTSAGQMSHEEPLSGSITGNNASSLDVNEEGDARPVEDVDNDSDDDVLPSLEPIGPIPTSPAATLQDHSLPSTLVSEPPFVTDGRGRVVGASPGPLRSVYSPTSPTLSPRPLQRRKPSAPVTEPPDGSGEFTTDGRGRVVSVGNTGSSGGSAEGASSSEQPASSATNSETRSFIGRMLDALF